jgi:hypothetical protein
MSSIRQNLCWFPAGNRSRTLKYILAGTVREPGCGTFCASLVSMFAEIYRPRLGPWCKGGGVLTDARLKTSVSGQRVSGPR